MRPWRAIVAFALLGEVRDREFSSGWVSLLQCLRAQCRVESIALECLGIQRAHSCPRAAR